MTMKPSVLSFPPFFQQQLVSELKGTAAASRLLASGSLKSPVQKRSRRRLGRPKATKGLFLIEHFSASAATQKNVIYTQIVSLFLIIGWAFGDYLRGLRRYLVFLTIGIALRAVLSCFSNTALRIGIKTTTSPIRLRLLSLESCSTSCASSRKN